MAELEIPAPPPPWDLPLPDAVEHDGIRTLRGVRFVSDIGYRPVRMDIHLPAAGEPPAPAVVFIHGGAWLFGDRDGVGPMYMQMQPDVFTAIAQQGIAVVSVDYRLTAEAVFPAQLHDVAAAQRFVVARASELGIDPERIAVWGESAGGHLAMLLAFQQGSDALGPTGAPVTCPPLAGLVDWYGVSDIRKPMGAFPLPGPTPEELLVGGPLDADPALADAASPVTRVRAGAPRTLIIHGTGDSLVPCARSEEVAAALVAAGVEVETIWLEGAEHAWIGFPDAAQEALEATLVFLTDVLRPQPASAP